jgi:hypothetical protein
MNRSYRGLGLVVLMLLVVAPLTLFAVLSLFEDESADAIKLSLDGEHWTTDVGGALLASEEPWTAGETRSAIVYVKNSGPAPVDADVTVVCRSTDQLVVDGHLTLTTQVDQEPAEPLAVKMTPTKVMIDGLAAESTVPVTVTATFGHTAPIGAVLDSHDVRLELRIKGARSEDAGPPSLLDAAGAQLWLAPILLVVAAGVALRVQARRGRETQGPGAGAGAGAALL